MERARAELPSGMGGRAANRARPARAAATEGPRTRRPARSPSRGPECVRGASRGPERVRLHADPGPATLTTCRTRSKARNVPRCNPLQRKRLQNQCPLRSLMSNSKGV